MKKFLLVTTLFLGVICFSPLVQAEELGIMPGPQIYTAELNKVRLANEDKQVQGTSVAIIEVDASHRKVTLTLIKSSYCGVGKYCMMMEPPHEVISLPLKSMDRQSGNTVYVARSKRSLVEPTTEIEVLAAASSTKVILRRIPVNAEFGEKVLESVFKGGHLDPVLY